LRTSCSCLRIRRCGRAVTIGRIGALAKDHMTAGRATRLWDAGPRGSARA
jgi:hypothetical protein